MGNPHAVVFMDGVKEMDLKEIGPAFESMSAFREGPTQSSSR